MVPVFERYGLALDSLNVQNISLPEELQAMLDKRIGVNMMGGMQAYTQFQTAEAIPLAAQNEGGLAGIGAGLGVGLGLGQQVGDHAAELGEAVDPAVDEAMVAADVHEVALVHDAVEVEVEERAGRRDIRAVGEHADEAVLLRDEEAVAAVAGQKVAHGERAGGAGGDAVGGLAQEAEQLPAQAQPATQSNQIDQILQVVILRSDRMADTLTTDYLIVGSGAVGLAFADPIRQMLRTPTTQNSMGLRLGNMPEIRVVIQEELERALQGQQTAKQAMDRAVERGNVILRNFERANRAAATRG